jgi:hypothetical protein
MNLEFIKEVAPITARTPHPEDTIFDGSSVAQATLQAMGNVIADPRSITIKWDGYPALLFGRNADGKLIVTDKYMFGKTNGHVTSPEEWLKYDQARGASRGDLYQRVSNIWAGLDQAVGNTPGFFWGDLLWSNPLEPVHGNYVFKPNIVEYHIPTNSNLGKLIHGRVGGVVVHQYMTELTAPPQPWNGSGLTMDGQVAIVTPSAGIQFQLNDPVQLHRNAAHAISQYGAGADSLLGGLQGVAKQAIKRYMNKTITGQTNEHLIPWLANEVSSAQYKKLVGTENNGYLQENFDQLQGLFAIWNAMYAFKNNLAQQLEKQVAGLQQFVDGRPEGEGFVFSTARGPVKLVQRTNFSRALFANQQ